MSADDDETAADARETTARLMGLLGLASLVVCAIVALYLLGDEPARALGGRLEGFLAGVVVQTAIELARRRRTARRPSTPTPPRDERDEAKRRRLS